MASLFISDLHLCAERPGKVALFKKLLRKAAGSNSALYILGDLFESWAGDDDITPPHQEIFDALAQYTDAGGDLFIMRGNRDYLMGRRFAENTGGVLLDDEVRITLNGQTVLLMHGDTLCTRDVKYQIFRRLVNNKASIFLFMLLPYGLRARLWRAARRATKRSVRSKGRPPLDAHYPAVERVMKKHQATCLIHGHTHRQGTHEIRIGEQPARRIVLGDWIQGDCVLAVDDSGFRLLGVDAYLQQS